MDRLVNRTGVLSLAEEIQERWGTESFASPAEVPIVHVLPRPAAGSHLSGSPTGDIDHSMPPSSQDARRLKAANPPPRAARLPLPAAADSAGADSGLPPVLPGPAKSAASVDPPGPPQLPRGMVGPASQRTSVTPPAAGGLPGAAPGRQAHSSQVPGNRPLLHISPLPSPLAPPVVKAAPVRSGAPSGASRPLPLSPPRSGAAALVQRAPMGSGITAHPVAKPGASGASFGPHQPPRSPGQNPSLNTPALPPAHAPQVVQRQAEPSKRSEEKLEEGCSEQSTSSPDGEETWPGRPEQGFLRWLEIESERRGGSSWF
jgi:hypothetical protein